MSDLQKSAKEGRLPGLVALRDVLAETIELRDTTPAERASLSQRLMVCLEQIEQLQRASKRGSKVDEIADRRAARRAGTAGAGGAAGHRVNRRTRGG